MWLRKYVIDLSKTLHVSVDIVVSAVLSVLSATLNNKVKMEINESWRLDVNLYNLVLAAPASKKDAIINNCFAELYEIRKENYVEQQQSSFELQSKIDALLQRYEKLKLQLIEDTEESEAIQKEMEIGRA